FPSAHSGSEH
ncbi:hypothetical protein QQF64_014249, partial [Cirrhinus molitorella]